MEYTVNRLAKMSGVSARTLRYYDEINLLSPSRINTNGYRIYGQKEIDKLQQILFYKELGVSLEEIKRIISSKDFNAKLAMETHLEALLAKREQLDSLIENVEKTILTFKGEMKMQNKDKFQGFIKKLVDDNEEKYGKEIRAKYGDEVIEKSNNKVKNMSKEDYNHLEVLSNQIDEELKRLVNTGDPLGEDGKKLYELHKEWISYYWDNYTKEAHIGVAQMYVDDERFTKYYDKNGDGSSKFLRDAIIHNCK